VIVGEAGVRLRPDATGFASAGEREIRRDARGRFTSAGEDAGRDYSSGFRRTGRIDVDVSGLSRVAQVFRDLDVIGGKVRTTLSAPFEPARVAAYATAAAGAAGAVTALAGGTVALGAGIASSLPVLLAVPGALIATQVAAQTLKLGLAGTEEAVGLLSDAFAGGEVTASEFEESLKALSPGARQVAREAFALRGQINDLRTSVQDRIFAPLEGEVDELGRVFLPILNRELGGIAGTLGDGAASIAQYVSSLAGADAVQQILANSGLSVQSVVAGLVEAVPGLLDLGAVFSRISTVVADDLGGALEELGPRLQAAADSGSLEAKFTQAYAAAKLFVGALVDIGATVGNVLNAAAPLGTVFLGRLNALTGAVRAFTGSAEGQDQLADFFASLQPVLQAVAQAVGLLLRSLAPLIPVVVQVAQILAQSLVTALIALQPAFGAFGQIVLAVAGPLGQLATIVAGVLAAALQAVAPAVPVLANAFLVLGTAIAQGVLIALQALAPYLPTLAAAFGQLVAAVAPLIPVLVSGLVAAFNVAAPIIAAFAGVLQALVPAFLVIVPVIGQIVTLLAGALAQALVAVTPLVSLVAQAIALLAPMFVTLLSALVPVAAQLLGLLLPALMQLVPIVAQVIAAIVPFVGQLLGALLPALMPVIAVVLQFALVLAQSLAPILPQIAALIVALVTAVAPLLPLIAALLQAFLPLLPVIIQLIGALLPPLINLLTLLAPVIRLVAAVITPLIAVLGLLVTAFARVLSVAISIVTGIMGLFARLQSAVIGAVQALATRVLAAFRTLMGNLPNAVQTGIVLVLSKFTGLPPQIIRALGSLAGLLVGAGGDLISGLISGIKGAAGRAAQAAKDAVSGAISAAKSALGINSPSRVFREIGAGVGEGLVLGLQGSRQSVADAAALLANDALIYTATGGRQAATVVPQLPPVPAATVTVVAPASTAPTRLHPDDLRALERVLEGARGTVLLGRDQVGTVVSSTIGGQTLMQQRTGG
jgi:phage-related protein